MLSTLDYYDKTIKSLDIEQNPVCINLSNVFKKRLHNVSNSKCSYSNKQIIALCANCISYNHMFVLGNNDHYQWGISTSNLLNIIYNKIEDCIENESEVNTVRLEGLKTLEELIQEGYNNYENTNAILKKKNHTIQLPFHNLFVIMAQQSALAIYNTATKKFEKELICFSTYKYFFLAGGETLHFYLPNNANVFYTSQLLRH